MSIATYSELKSAVARWIKRTDLDSVIPDLIALAEARISRDLRLRQQVKNTTLTTTPGVQGITLPADWLEFENINLVANPPRNLTYVNIEHLEVKYPGDFTGLPAVYTMEGDKLLLGPVPDGAYPLDVYYYARFDALSDTTPTNWLLTNHPSIYLFATLAEAEPFVVNDERSVLWEGKYTKDMLKLKEQDDAAMFSGSALRVRTIK